MTLLFLYTVFESVYEKLYTFKLSAGLGFVILYTVLYTVVKKPYTFKYIAGIGNVNLYTMYTLFLNHLRGYTINQYFV